MSNITSNSLLKALFGSILVVTPIYLLGLRGILDFPRTLNLGIVEIRYYALAILLGIGLVGWLFAREKNKYADLNKIDVIDALIFILVPAIICARLWHVMTDFPIYRGDLAAIFQVWNGGLGLFGGLVGGFIGAWFFTRQNKFPLGNGISLLVVFLPLGQLVGRFGNFFNQELYGKATDLPWGFWVRAEQDYFHPAFAYEQIGLLVLFLILYALYKKYGLNQALIAVYLVGYAITRFLVDFSRTEPRVFLNLTVAQIVCVVLILLGGLYFVRLGTHNRANG